MVPRSSTLTEKNWLGQENDYVIDYNTSEITFTPNKLITKDKRIVVEFQYSDKNYARSVIESVNSLEIQNWKFQFNLYSEQDSKPTASTKVRSRRQDVLALVGDDMLRAVVPSGDSVGYSSDQVRYALIDSLGYDSVFIYSTNQNQAFYQVIFSDLGQGNADYLQDEFSSFGRTYKWVAPDTINGQIFRNGRYAPVQVLIAPKKRQMATLGIAHDISKYSKVNFEIAASNFDQNTFSQFDRFDNQGYGVKANYKLNKPIKDKPWKLIGAAQFESISKHFNRIERFRSVEFDRNWNIRNAGYDGKPVQR